MKFVLGIGLALLLLCGCRTAGSGEKRSALASVTFHGNTPGQITRVVDQVFASHGYSADHQSPSTLEYEKEGSVGSNILYGNWLGEGVWIRVKAHLVPIGPGDFRMDCMAYRVRDRGSSVEEEIPFSRINKGAFQKLLNECAEKLKPALNVPDPN